MPKELVPWKPPISQENAQENANYLVGKTEKQRLKKIVSQIPLSPKIYILKINKIISVKLGTFGSTIWVLKIWYLKGRNNVANFIQKILFYAPIFRPRTKSSSGLSFSGTDWNVHWFGINFKKLYFKWQQYSKFGLSANFRSLRYYSV